MPQLKIMINDKGYDVACEEGQEKRLTEVADLLSEKVDQLAESLGQIGDTRLMLMAGLLIADDLYDTQDELRQAKATGGNGSLNDARAYVGQVFEEVTARMEGLIETLEPSVEKPL